MNETCRAVIFDISGVLEFQGTVYPGAIELLDTLRAKGVYIRILTNSTLKSRKSWATKLIQMGFTVYEQEVITAASATAQYLRQLKPRSCWVMLKGEGLKEFKDFHHDLENPEYIVVGDYRDEFNFHNMNRALKLLLQGSKLIVMIPELVDSSMGAVELTVGAYGKILEMASKVEATYIGKPNKFIFEMALNTMDVPRDKVLMVGDRVTSDIAGARRVEIKSVLVKTGEFKESDLAGNVQPDFMVNSILEILQLNLF
jgi:HAD superfamily hydrolase (TIGR01458 family)